jgi:hypothetical protein
LKKVLLASTLVAALAFTSVAAASLSPSAYRAKVNGICATGVKALNAMPKPSQPSGYYAYFKKATAASDALLVKVVAVKPPTSLQAAVATAAAKQLAFENALHTLTNKLKTSKNPRQTVLAAGKKLDKLNNAANAAWRAAGLTKCAA